MSKMSSLGAGPMKSMRIMKTFTVPARRVARHGGVTAKAAEVRPKMVPILKKPSGVIDDSDEDTAEIIKKPAAKGVAKVLEAIEKMKQNCYKRSG